MISHKRLSILCGCRLRELTTSEVGRLVSVTGVVTRTSEVRPELLQGTFKCLDCGNVIKNVEQQFKYTEVCICMTPLCIVGCLDKWGFRNLIHVGCSQQFVSMQLVQTEETGHCFVKKANLQIGKEWGCRKLLKRYQQGLFLDHLMSFYDMRLSNRPGRVTRTAWQ